MKTCPAASRRRGPRPIDARGHAPGAERATCPPPARRPGGVPEHAARVGEALRQLAERQPCRVARDVIPVLALELAVPPCGQCRPPAPLAEHERQGPGKLRAWAEPERVCPLVMHPVTRESHAL